MAGFRLVTRVPDYSGALLTSSVVLLRLVPLHIAASQETRPPAEELPAGAPSSGDARTAAARFTDASGRAFAARPGDFIDCRTDREPCRGPDALIEVGLEGRPSCKAKNGHVEASVPARDLGEGQWLLIAEANHMLGQALSQKMPFAVDKRFPEVAIDYPYQVRR